MVFHHNVLSDKHLGRRSATVFIIMLCFSIGLVALWVVINYKGNLQNA